MPKGMITSETVLYAQTAQSISIQVVGGLAAIWDDHRYYFDNPWCHTLDLVYAFMGVACTFGRYIAGIWLDMPKGRQEHIDMLWAIHSL